MSEGLEYRRANERRVRTRAMLTGGTALSADGRTRWKDSLTRSGHGRRIVIAAAPASNYAHTCVFVPRASRVPVLTWFILRCAGFGDGRASRELEIGRRYGP